jgi:hypothetical protein
MKQSTFYSLITLECISLSIIIFLISKQQICTFNIVIIGNVFLALLTSFSYLSSSKSANDSNPNKFVQGVMKNTVLKFFVIIIATFVLIYTQKAIIKKVDIFLLMGIYILYSVLETVMLSILARKKK